MPRFWRRDALHRQLAEAAGLSLGVDAAPPLPLAQAADPPGFDGERRAEAGIHGVPRRRRWDVVAAVEAPGLRGDAVHYVALPDGSLVVEEDEPDNALEPLADAVERALTPPYRAEAVRRSGPDWSIAAERIEIVEVKDLLGDEAELSVTRDGRILRLDGRTVLGSSRALERAAQGRGTEYVVRARRVDGDLWEVESAAL